MVRALLGDGAIGGDGARQEDANAHRDRVRVVQDGWQEGRRQGQGARATKSHRRHKGKVRGQDGKEITGAKRDALFKVYEDYIEAINVTDPTLVVRGAKNAKGKNMF